MLASVNSAGHAIIKVSPIKPCSNFSLPGPVANASPARLWQVDNTTTLASGANRESVKITSNDLYGIGTLQVWDAVHTPYGCSVWPAMWSVGQNWPAQGEIDTFEGVNALTYNAMTLHTANGCVTSQGNETGTLACKYPFLRLPCQSPLAGADLLTRFADQYCSAYDNANSGCGVTDNTNVSYGAAFAANGGGVWATELAPSGVSVWFFPRPSVPDNLQNSSMIPDPSTWGTPSAHFSNTTCSIADFFGDQQLVIDITLCGDWAGNSYVFSETCTGTCTDLVTTPSNYDQAFFEIRSVRVYTDTTKQEQSETPTATASGSASASTGKTSSAGRSVAGSTAAALFAVAAAAVAMA